MPLESPPPSKRAEVLKVLSTVELNILLHGDTAASVRPVSCLNSENLSCSLRIQRVWNMYNILVTSSGGLQGDEKVQRNGGC